MSYLAEDYYDEDDSVAVITPRGPQMVRITGNSYPVKDQLKAMGCKFEGWAKAWFCPVEKAAAAQAVVDAATPPPAPVVVDANGEVAEATGAYVGTIGAKIAVAVTVASVREFETEFNRKKVIQTLVKFTDADGRVLAWKTCADFNGKVTLRAAHYLTWLSATGRTNLAEHRAMWISHQLQ